MRTALLALLAFLALPAFGQEVDLGKPIDDGVRPFVVGALTAVQKDPNAKARIEPFALGLTGWKMRGMAPFLFSTYEALQFKVAALGLGVWDPDLGKAMAAIADRAKPDEPATLTDDERSKLNLGTIAHAERFTKLGGVPQWEYFVGAGLGELGTNLTLWIYMQEEESLATDLTKNLKGLGEKADKAPKGADKELVADLKSLAGMAKDKYARPDIEKIAEAATKAMQRALKAG
ncbi:MAG: hypothetical protein M9921_11215 [Fimbriimonadaceae bacterium]|nr:hypothetical protein [Fimbriimonadaceae bacterium]